MGYQGTLPLSVVDGMTGQTTLTNHGVLLGAATAPVNAATVGNDGDLFRGNTGLDPSFGNTSDGNFSFAAAAAGSTMSCTVSNTDNTNAASSATLAVTCGGANAGPTRYQFVIPSGSNNWCIGVDNATTTPEADPLNLVTGTTPGILGHITYQKSGIINLPLNVCFLSILGTQVNNVTGNGGAYSLGTTGGTALTEIFDQDNNISTAGTFTAPVAGIYDLRTCVTVIGTSTSSLFTINIVTASRTFQYERTTPASGATQSIYLDAMTSMAAGETANVVVVVTGEAANTDDIAGGGAPILTYICGTKVA